jgi:hypothetical protein
MNAWFLNHGQDLCGMQWALWFLVLTPIKFYGGALIKLVEMVSLLVKFIHNFMPWFWPLVSRSSVGTCRFKILPLPNDVGPQNLTVGCWELNLNLSHPVQLSRASHYYILRVHKTRDQRWVMLWCIVAYVSFMLIGDFSCSDTFLDQELFLIIFFLIGHNIYMSGPWQRL